MKEKVFQITPSTARKHAKMNRLEASKALGIGVDTLARWERDPKNIKAEYQYKMAELYGVPLKNIIFLPND